MRRPTHLGPVSAVAPTLLALVGVLALGWSAAALLGVFVLELAATLCWAVVRMPFATKRPNNALRRRNRLLSPLQETRGALSLPGLPPVYPRNVPTMLVAVFLLVPLEIGAAFAVFAATDPTITAAVAGQVLLGGAVAFAGRGVETYVDYFRNGGYREHSARSVLLAPFKQFFGVGALLFVFTAVDAGSRAVVILVLVAKVLYDLRTLQVERDPEKRGVFYRLYGSEETEIEPAPVAVPDRAPALRVRVPRRVALADAGYRGVRYVATSPALVLPVGAVLAVVAGVPAVISAGLLAGAFAFAALRATVRYLRYGTLEYRCYEGLLVVFDTLLDEPRARLERTAIADARASADAVDRAFGRRTLELDAAGEDGPAFRLTVPDPEAVGADDVNENRSVTLPHLADPATVLDCVGASWRLDGD